MARFVPFLFLFIYLPLSTDGQVSQADSIKALVTQASGIQKVMLMLELSGEIFTEQPDIAMRYADTAMILAGEHDEKSLYARALMRKAIIYTKLNNFRISIEVLRQALAMYEKLGERDKAATALERLAINYRNIPDYDSAMYFYRRASEIYEDLNDSSGMAESLSNIGYMYRKVGDFDSSLEFYLKAYDLFSGTDNKEKEALLLSRIGSVYTQIKDYDNAITYYLLSLDLRKEIGDEHGIAASLNNIGNVYMYQDSLNPALEYYFKALEINSRTGNEKYMSFNLHNIAIIYDMKGMPEKGMEYLDRSISIKQKRKDTHGLASSYNSKGLMYLNMGEHQNAIHWLMQSMELGRKISYRENILRNYENLEQVYLSMGNYIDAYNYLKKYEQLKDSLLNEEKLKTIAEFQAKLETALKEKENQELKNSLSQVQKKEESHRRFQLLLLVIIIALIIVGFLLVLNLRLRRRTLLKDKTIAEKSAEQYKSQLEFRNRELTANALNLARNNEMINAVIGHVRDLEKHTDEKGKAKLLELIINLKKNTQQNAWKEFQTRFENVHSRFYENLRRKYPGLTPNELRLCAFLRLNMTSKDIAALTYLSVRSVETARSRLRKKLDIPSDSSLVNHLASF